MNKDRLIKLLVIGGILIIVLVLIVLDMRRPNFSTYDKYSLRISIIEGTQDKNGTKVFNVRDDGKKAKVTSSNIQNETYIFDKELYYLKDNTFYKFNFNRSYRDLNNLVSKIRDCDKTKVEKDVSYYSAALSAKKTNEILEALFFGKKTSSESLANFTVKENKIQTFNLTLSDIPGYEEITVTLKFNELNDTYNVNTPKVFRSKNEFTGTDILNFENTNENIYEIVK